MSEGSTRFVAFGGSRIRIVYSGRRASEIVEFLYRDARDAAESPLQATFRVEDDAPRGSVTVRRDGGVCYRGTSLADAAQALQEATSFSLAAGTVGGLLFHAAAVSWRGRVLLLPGASGFGKTTLTAWLLSCGCQYLTDELSFVADGSVSIEALSRPLNVKASGLGALPDGLCGPGGGWASLRSSVAALLQPPSPLMGSENGRDARETVAALVFPRYEPAGTCRLAPLSHAQAGLRLMSCLLNARNLKDHGFPSVAALARRIPSHELRYGNVAEAAPRILGLLL